MHACENAEHSCDWLIFFVVVESWVTIEFRWYPRMRGLDWAIYSTCKFCTCTCAGVRCCIGTIGPCFGTAAVAHRWRCMLWHLPCVCILYSCACIYVFCRYPMLMMCMYHCMCWVGVIRMAILILYLLCMCGMPWIALWVVEVVVNSTVCVLLHIIHY